MPDLKNHAVQQQAMMEAFFFAYQAFTTKPDEMLARRGLGRVHHRVLFFIARYPGLSVKELLALLGVTKQALNIPLRQLLEMNLIGSAFSNRTPSAVRPRRRLRLSSSAGGRPGKVYSRNWGHGGFT
ncbi:MarR family transcriptional regulator, partial [Pseudomonas aeruginosa]|uniref:MarR family transcriptional regulator n=2 Tax=Pseudomonas aeruginosa TaxID=287 RepID=UPI001F5C1FFE